MRDIMEQCGGVLADLCGGDVRGRQRVVVSVLCCTCVPLVKYLASTCVPVQHSIPDIDTCLGSYQHAYKSLRLRMESESLSCAVLAQTKSGCCEGSRTEQTLVIFRALPRCESASVVKCICQR